VAERILGDLRDAVARTTVASTRADEDTDDDATESATAPPAVVKPEAPANDTTATIRRVG